jgi:DNA-binding NtrC family response regulator
VRHTTHAFRRSTSTQTATNTSDRNACEPSLRNLVISSFEVEDPRTRVRLLSRITRYAKVRVSVEKGPDAGATLDIAGVLLRIGSAADNDLVLSDQTVSRHHCELQPVEGGVRVRDAGSTNGIALGGARIYDAMIPGEFRLRLGDSVLAVNPLPETEEHSESDADRFGAVLGASPRMRELYAQLERIASSHYTLLLEGETGTGKDVIAESVHEKSPRGAQPFVVFDCGAVSANLIESELFGHERGAFTGAQTSHAGVFEQADGGTLFLDEIGELPLELQPKLLRVLERRELRRVGGSRNVAVDVRIIAATNRNLRAELKRGAFRQDLYYRLAQAHVFVPPLRERAGDIELLCRHFLASDGAAGAPAEMPHDVLAMFLRHRWPGNVRELRNAVRRFCISPERALLTGVSRDDELAGFDGDVLPPLAHARREHADAFEREYVTRALELAGRNVPRAAELAGISRQMMLRLAHKHGLR